MFSARRASLTRWLAARVLNIHADTLHAIANEAERAEEKAWDGVFDAAAQVEREQALAAQRIADAEKLHEVRRLDASRCTKNADNVCQAVTAELDSLPYIQPKV